MRLIRNRQVQEELPYPDSPLVAGLRGKTAADLHAMIDNATMLQGQPAPIASFTLTKPPSVNSLFPGKARRFKSQDYKAWIKENEFRILFKFPPVTGPVEVSIQVNITRGDLDNLNKAVLDLLVSCGVIQADSVKVVRKVSIEQNDEIKEGECVVTVWRR